MTLMLVNFSELVGIMTEVRYDTDKGALVWQYDSKETYTSQSLYVIINFRGVTPVFILAIIKDLKSHLEFMFFSGYYHICLLKSGVVKPEVCLLCDEKETLNHLFFDCVVAGKGFMLFCLQALE